MEYIHTPITYEEKNLIIQRSLTERTAMIDNLVELIVFTPRGSFAADPDFGFEYWNHEYSNVNIREFNNGQGGSKSKSIYNDVTRRECQESVEKSLATYEPTLKHIHVDIELRDIAPEKITTQKLASKYEVAVKVSAMQDDGLGILTPYSKIVTFLMEPTAKRYNI